MGEAKLRLMKETRLVTFDFTAPKIRGDVAQIVRMTITAAINAKFPQGQGRADGKILAGWLEDIDECFEEGAAGKTVEMSLGQVEWLYRILADDNLKVPPGLAGSREALIEYMDGLRKQPEGAS